MDDGGTRPATSQKKPAMEYPDGELVELLWQNGGVVAQPQANQRSSLSGVTAEEEAAGWLHDGGGGDLYSQLWHSIANGDGGAAARSGAGSSRSGEVGSSFCGSNLVTAPAPPPRHAHDDALPTPAPEEEEEERARAAVSSSGGSFKRGRGDEDAGNETRPSTRRPAAKRRARAAEVHNQSERRRRDRINEKMRALQELVPHCNKTDKASVLDEAIEYLKSLEMQVQIMWMTTGMTPMMFPGAHQMMSPMAMGLNSACMPAAQGLGHLQRATHYMNNPVPSQMPQMGQSASINAQNVPNQVHNDHNCGPRNPFLHPDDTIAATPQVQGLFPYGSHIAQQNDIQELLVSPGIASSSDGKPPGPMINLQATGADEQKKPEQLVLEE